MDEIPFMEMLDRISPKLRRYAGYLAFKSDNLTIDDCYQEAVLKLWERYINESDFLCYPDSYRITFGTWMMKNMVNRERNMYTKRIVIMETDEEEDTFLLGHFPRPESEAVRSEVFSIAEKMPQYYKTIFGATCQGYMLKELAKYFDISLGAVKWRKRMMVERMSMAYHTCSNERPNIIAEMYELPTNKSIT